MQDKPVLVVDNDSETVELVTEALKPYGYEVLAASSGTEGLAMAAQHQPSVIFINLAVPGTEGLKICKTFMTTDSVKDIPLVLLTMREGKYDPRYRAQYGIVDFLKKPLDPMELVAKTSQFAPPAPSAELLGEEAVEAAALEIAGEDVPSLDELGAEVSSFGEALEAVEDTDVSPGDEVFEAEEAAEEPRGLGDVREPSWPLPDEEEPLEATEEAIGEVPGWTLPEEEPLEIIEEAQPLDAEEEEPLEATEEALGEVPGWTLPEEKVPDAEPVIEDIKQKHDLDEPPWSIPEEEPTVIPVEEPPALAKEEPDWSLPEEEPLEVSEEELPAEFEEEDLDSIFTDEEENELARAREESSVHDGEESGWALPEEEPLTPVEEDTAASLEEAVDEDIFGFGQEDYATLSEEEPVTTYEPQEPEYAAVRATALEALKRRKSRSRALFPLLAVLVVGAAAALLYIFFISGGQKAAPPAPPMEAVTEAREPAPAEPAVEAPKEEAKVEEPPAPAPVKTARPAPPKTETQIKKPVAVTPKRVYYVQFGAFRSKDNADRLLKKLRGLEYESFVSKSTLKGEPIYLVLLSTRFTDKWNAFKQAKHIKETSDLTTSVHIAKP